MTKNIIELLKIDHKNLKIIMNEIEDIIINEDIMVDELFQQFKKAFYLHDKIEDQLFYPELLKIPTLKLLGMKSYQAHHVVEVGILELKLLPYSSETWGPKFLVIKDSILDHLQEEEETIFPLVEKKIDLPMLKELGQQMIDVREAVS